MKSILIIKILYYFLFALIFIFSLIVFFEITDFSFYSGELRDFFHRILNILNF